jgi:hypothetical protein
MTRRRIALRFAVPFVAVFALGLGLLLATAAAAQDGPHDGVAIDAPTIVTVTVSPAWYHDPAVLTCGVVVGVYGLIAGLQTIGRTRWRWTRWLRVGRVQGHLAGVAGMLSVVIDAASAGTLQPRAAIVGCATWLLARNMPGSGEPKPEKPEAVA